MKDKFIYAFAVLPILAITLVLQIYKVEPFENFSLTFNDIDFSLQKKEPNKDIVFVAVDEPSVNRYGRWPWDRRILAKGIDRLTQADVVLMDMIFSEPTGEVDEVLAESLSGLNNSVCGFFLRDNATQVISDDELDVLSDSTLDLLQSQFGDSSRDIFPSAKYAEINILPIMEACSLSGSFSTFRASDDKLRSYPTALHFGDGLYPSLAIQGLRLRLNKDLERVDNNHLKIGKYIIKIGENGLVRLNFYDLDKYDVVSFLDVATGVVKPEYFKNKIVILGITEVGAGDIANTPIGSIPGPLLHYTFLSNLLNSQLIVEYKYITPILIVMMVLLPLILIFSIKKILYRTLLNILIYLVVYGYVRYLFVVDMIYIDLFFPLLSLIFSMVVVEAVAFNIQEKKGKFMKDTFSSYLSGDLLNKLIENPESLKLGGEKKELSILFSDIRGFTTISESMSPEKLIKILNRYFTPMTESVLENGGMLDKYIGDAVMAFFNAPVDLEKHADASCDCALSMIEKLERLNKELVSENILPIRIGIGINSAEVIVGNIGSDAKKDYTVIGDGVNLASRVEGLTKNYGIEILITEFTVAKLTKEFIYREMEPVKVKGKDEAVLLYQLMPNSEESKKIKSLYDEALALYKDSSFEKAEKLFNKLVKEYEDNPSKYFLPLAKEKHPWGVHKMTTK